MTTYAQATPVQRRLRGLVANGPGAWLGIRLLQRVDEPALRLTRGRSTLSSLLTGLPVVWLTTTGARSGRSRTVPILGFSSAEGLAVIASNFGQARHPAWYHNLRAHPEAEVVVAGRRQRVRAVEVRGERRERIWREGLEIYPGWAAYERRASERRIAVLVLEEA